MNIDRVLIFTGGNLSPKLLDEIEASDYIIGADRGALFLIEHGIKPHIAVGDFDSISKEQLEQVRIMSGDTMTCDPIQKDLTDTELAMDIALNRKPEQILIIGATGTRMDHTLANIQMLTRGVEQHVQTSIVDLNNYITLTNSSCMIEDKGYTYVSLLPMTPVVTGIYLEGFQYPLYNATLHLGESLGISNRLTAERGTIKIDDGLLLIIQSKDH
ncbi:thiamine diphosphokinase [Paenibacillus lemnae]|uniref:Thiamine diphosphokinase n=1 Tax=Paenibacillus lemnae TaxID=1330551 RepID=A0A848M8W1_PAELE|nr:thiamine diphosphokinase [Paenibacillus lemnae]NMO95944.1 thiamine diphosphokinase [Paenibacillus lemnae]